MESFEAGLPLPPPEQPPLPAALVSAHRVTGVNAAAQALGVQPGMKRATALALAPDLALGQADATRDLIALTSVAHGALAFTPTVSLVPPQGVLMEVQASLRYFGGGEALLARLERTLAPLGHSLQCASAATAHGASLLAQWQGGLHCGTDLACLHRTLSEAPVGLLMSARVHAPVWEGMGLRRIGELRRLPREGLARRFGETLLSELDRSWGLQPDPREPLLLPPSFESGVEFFSRVDTTEQLLHGAEVLLARLVTWLVAQQAFVRRFTLVMKHERRGGHGKAAAFPGFTPLDVALASPSRDPAHLLSLLRERLARQPLPAPALELVLRADDIAHQPPPNAELFPTPRSESEGLTRLVERLQARLHPSQLQRWLRVADHRPEKSFRIQPAEPGLGVPRERRGAGERVSAPCGRPARPVWVLPQAQPLLERGASPLLDGQALRLLSGPERIEAGWWDEGGESLAERDYFIASTPDGALVWLYRARLSTVSGGWFLQGRFG